MVTPNILANEYWWKRASLPNYRVGRAAQLVDLNPSTLSRWQNSAYVIPKRDRGKGVSYLQLIEAAVVAQMRDAHVKLSEIRSARAFVATKLDSDYPFATHRFSTDGIDILMDFDDVFKGDGDGKRVIANRGGQLGWSAMFSATLRGFEYFQDTVVRWKLAGAESPIIVDPRVGFGAPTVSGIPTETIYTRWASGVQGEELADEYEISRDLVRAAVNFEAKIRNDPERYDLE